MDNHTKLFACLCDETIPPGLHGSIMRKVFFRHYARFPVPFLMLFFCNIILSGWRVWTKFAEADIFSILHALGESFEWSFSFVSDFITTLFSVLPLFSLLIFLINIAIIAYLGKISWQWHRLALSQTA